MKLWLKILPFIHRRIVFERFVSSSARKTRVVILGTGWGSYSALRTIDRNLFDVKVIAPRNHFLFTPLLCSTAVGTLEFRSIIEPVRNIGFKNPSDFILAHAEELDLTNQKITCRSLLEKSSPFSVPYDKLVIGVGCESNTFGVPGVSQHASFLKEISHARNIRGRILSNCEKALLPHTDEESQRLLHTVIVGGGPTGIEFGAELFDFKTQDVRRLFKSQFDHFKVTLIEASDILGSFDQKLRTYAEKKLGERRNFHLLKSSVVEVKEDGVILKDGRVLPCGLVVWSTGLSPRTFTQKLDVPKNSKGQILSDEFLRVIGDPNRNVYAVGDCADIESLPLPCTAQVAERQGRYLAQALNSSERNAEVKPFAFKSSGMLAYIGNYEGLTDLPDFKVQGFSSWLLWRSAYLTRLGSWRLRMQVPMDWLKTLLFGRDTSHFY